MDAVGAPRVLLWLGGASAAGGVLALLAFWARAWGLLLLARVAAGVGLQDVGRTVMMLNHTTKRSFGLVAAMSGAASTLGPAAAALLLGAVSVWGVAVFAGCMGAGQLLLAAGAVGADAAAAAHTAAGSRAVLWRARLEALGERRDRVVADASSLIGSLRRAVALGAPFALVTLLAAAARTAYFGFISQGVAVLTLGCGLPRATATALVVTLPGFTGGLTSVAVASALARYGRRSVLAGAAAAVSGAGLALVGAAGPSSAAAAVAGCVLVATTTTAWSTAARAMVPFVLTDRCAHSSLSPFPTCARAPRVIDVRTIVVDVAYSIQSVIFFLCTSAHRVCTVSTLALLQLLR